jgi:hypothetical protein
MAAGGSRGRQGNGNERGQEGGGITRDMIVPAGLKENIGKLRATSSIPMV